MKVCAKSLAITSAVISNRVKPANRPYGNEPRFPSSVCTPMKVIIFMALRMFFSEPVLGYSEILVNDCTVY